MPRSAAAAVDDPTLAVCPICGKPTRHMKQYVGGDGVEGPSYGVPTYHATCVSEHPERVQSKWHQAIRRSGGKAI